MRFPRQKSAPRARTFAHLSIPELPWLANIALDPSVADGRPSGPPSGACGSTRIRWAEPGEALDPILGRSFGRGPRRNPARRRPHANARRTCFLGDLRRFGSPRVELGNRITMVQDRPMAKPALDLSALTADEKLDLIDEIWGSFGPADFSLDDAQRAELDHRLELLERNGPVGTPWEEVRARMSRTGP